MIAEFEVDERVAHGHGSAAEVPQADRPSCDAQAGPFVQHRQPLVAERCGLAPPEAGSTPRLPRRGPGGARAAAAADHLETVLADGPGVWTSLPRARGAGPCDPKLRVGVPTMRTPGPRLPVRPGGRGARVRRAPVLAIRRPAEEADASSVRLACGMAADQETAAERAAKGARLPSRAPAARSGAAA